VSCAVSQHGIKLGFGDSWSDRRQSSWSANHLWAWYSTDVVEGVVAHRDELREPSEVQEFGEEAVDQCAATDGLDAGNQ
jgi:hypothetical protein